MTEQINLTLPDAIAQQAKDIATLTQQTLEDVLLQFVEDAIANFPIESLSDEQILTLCDLQITARQQEDLSDLLAKNKEGELNHLEQQKLADLMQCYRQGTLKKAKALKVAVSRGLRPPLSA
jgi:DNA primase